MRTANVWCPETANPLGGRDTSDPGFKIPPEEDARAGSLRFARSMTVADASDPAAAPAPPVGPTTSGERSLAPDLARGSVLLFIALANVAVYYFSRTLNVGGRPVDGSGLDDALDLVVNLLVDQRSYPMFAILFGYGMAKVASRQLAAGRGLGAARRLLVRRQLWLLAFGLVHAALLFHGDILGTYAVTGLWVVLFLGAHARTLAIVSAVTLVPLVGLFGSAGAQQSYTERIGENTSYLIAAGERLLLSLGIVLASGITLALVGLFLIGVLLERAGWLDRPWEHLTALRRVAVAGTAVGVLGALPKALQTAGVLAPGAVGNGASFLLSALHALSGVAAGLAYVCLFALVAAGLRGRQVPAPLRALAATGERSLTAYLLQSVLLAPVLSAWGLGLGDTIPTSAAYLLGVVTWAVTVAVCALLARSGNRGPAEALLRRLTYGPTRPDQAISPPVP